jgi:hypothetical protein
MRGAIVVLLAGAACSRTVPPVVVAPASAPAVPTAPPFGPLLDAEVRAMWIAAKIDPAPDASEAELLRRATLDIAGRVPTRAEVAGYRGDKAALVDRLLLGPDYAEHWADVYEDLLVGRARLRGNGRTPAHEFLADAFARNLRWDELATRILTATGPLDSHGEAGFIVAHAAMGGSPEATAGATARVFLGLQLQCAQCHDHPYDPRYKQDDFYGLAAFFARTRGRPFSTADGDRKTVELFDVPVGQIRMTRHATGETVEIRPRFLGRDPGHGPTDLRRVVLAREIVASDLFAKAAVNRTWAELFGRGLVEPWDDLGGENDPDHPPLLRLLAAHFVASGYDLRDLVRTIVLSEAYGRASTGGGAGAEAVFARAAARPLGAEALFRSLRVATGVDNVPTPRITEEQRQKRYEQGLKQFVFVFGDDEMGEVDRGSGTVQQALLLFNGELTNQAAKARPGSELSAILGESRDPSRRLDAMFAAAYARAPTDAERARLLPGLRGPASYEDLFFALLTSTEFTTCH